ncbi:MAG TPA: UMP kinase [Candidatus Saccharimonadales bacterium]|nr:UMP kinase [Candidatus Saccharimonadales bacterium]
MSYKRILLKISGEQLAGKHEFGIDPEIAKFLAHECARVVQAGCQLVLIVGGGNMVRGAEVAGHGIKRVTADHMGMLSCLMNAMALTDIFEHEGVRTRCMSNIFATQVAEDYSFRLAEKHLRRGRVVIIAGGIGRPYFTTDTGALNLALELSCEIVLKATKVDGVYDKDPAKFEDAELLKSVTFQQAVENPQIKVMDKAALGLAMDQNMPVIVFDPMKKDNILKAATGEPIGTKIS